MLRTDVFSGWSRHPTADGIILLPPGGLAAGPIRLREKLPLRPLRAYVDDSIRESGPQAASAAKVGPLERFVTYEGELAGVVTVTMAFPAGQTLERTFAMVAGDDLCAVVDGATATAADFPLYRDIVRQLAESYYMGLGELRRRPYEYVPPPGWIGVARPYVAEWYAPGFPGQAAFIRVFDARPLEGGEVENEGRSLTVENRLVTLRPLGPIMPGNAPAGHLWRGSGTQDGRTIHVLRARLDDGRFAYLAQLNADDDALDEATARFEELLRSVQPIPKRGAPPAEHLTHWLD